MSALMLASRLVILSAVFFLCPLAIAQPVTIEPPDPTSATPVTLVVQLFGSCPPTPTASVEGTNIAVFFDGVDLCLSPPTLHIWKVPVGVLAPGGYHVTLADPDGPWEGEWVFQVRDAIPDVLVTPSIGPATGGTEVLIQANVEHCEGRDVHTCPPPSITIGGIAATHVEAVNLSLFKATTPAHSPGGAEVVVTSGAITQASRTGFRYYDPSGAPPRSMFARVLVPLWFAGPGAYGSDWVTELSVLNDKSYAVSLFPMPALGSCVTGCRAIPPLIPQRFGFGEQLPTGVFLYVPRDSDAGLHFGTLVRDTTRQASSWGTSIPIVREDDFSTAAIHLLDIPLDPRSRVTLRVYGLHSMTEFVGVTVYSMDTGGVIDQQYLRIDSSQPCELLEPCGSDRPAFGTIGNFRGVFDGLPAEGRIGVRIFGGLFQPLWAFVSITNNDTQQVTVISPH